MAVQRVKVVYDIDDRDIKRAEQELRKMGRAAGMTDAEIDDMNRSLRATPAQAKKASTAMNAMGTAAKALGPIFAAVFAVDQIVRFAGEIGETAVKLDTLGDKSKTVFGESIEIVREWANENARAMGLSKKEAENAATSIGDLLIPMKFSREEAAKMSTDLVGLSGALSEWTGGQIEATEVSNILSKAVLGEREQLKTLGISIMEADVQQKLLEKGQKKLTGTALQQAKAQATLELIFEKSTDAQESFRKGGDKLVRQQAVLNAMWKDFKDQLAENAIPALRSFLDWIFRAIDASGPLVDVYRAIGAGIMRLSNVFVGFLKGLGLVNKEVDTAQLLMKAWAKGAEVMSFGFRKLIEGLTWLFQTGLPATIGGFAALGAATREVFGRIAQAAVGVAGIMTGQFKNGAAAIEAAFTGMGAGVSDAMDEAFGRVISRFRGGMETAQDETKKTAKEVSEFKKTVNDTDKAVGKFARGSMQWFNEQVKLAKDRLDRAVVGSKGWLAAIADLKKATEDLAKAQAKLNVSMKDPEVVEDLEDRISQIDEMADAIEDATTKTKGLTDAQKENAEEAPYRAAKAEAQALADLEAERAAKRAQELENLQTGFGMLQQSADLFGQVLDSIAARQISNAENSAQMQLHAIETAKNRELELYGRTEEEKERINEKFAKKTKKVEKDLDDQRRRIANEQAKQQKALAIFKAVISTAAAVVSMLQAGPAGIPLAIAAGITGAAQIGIIASEPVPQFKDGVIDLQGPGHGTSDSIAAKLSRGESVMTAKETSQYKPTLKAIRAGHVSPDVLNAVATGQAPKVTVNQEQVVSALRNLQVTNVKMDIYGFSQSVARINSNTEYINQKYDL